MKVDNKQIRDTFLQTLLALTIGVAGAVAAASVGFPAPYLTGPALSVTLASLASFTLQIPNFLRDVCFILIGMSMGASATPDVLVAAQKWPASFLILIMTVIAVIVSCMWILRNLFKYDRNSAVLASSPGHLSYVLGLSMDVKADIKSVSIVQSLRVLALTLLVPFIVVGFNSESIPSTLSNQTRLWLPHLLLIFIASLTLGAILKRFRIPAAFLLAGMFISTFGHITDATPGIVPLWLTIPTFLIMGTMLGTRFQGVTLDLLKQSFLAGFTVTFISATIAVLAAIPVAWLLSVPASQVLIAFAPGGVETMVALAIMLDAEPSFVAAHHVLRLVFLTFAVPFILGFTSQNTHQ